MPSFVELGHLAQHGRSYELAVGYYERSAALGDIIAKMKLRHTCRNGLGCAQDYGKARELFEAARAAGESQATVNPVMMHEKDMGGNQRCKKARELEMEAEA